MAAKGSGKGASARTSGESRGGTKAGSKTNAWKGSKGGGSWSKTMTDKHGSSGHGIVGDASDWDGVL